MKRILVRIAGIALVVAGIAGLIFCIVALVILAQTELRVETSLMEQLDLLDRTLLATADGLELAEVTLSQAATTAGALEQTVTTLGGAVGDSAGTVDAAAELLGEKLPATIGSAQGTLATLAESARIIDNLLIGITSIPLLRIERYDPELSLSEGVEEVAGSLAEIPRSLQVAGDGLRAASDSVGTLQKEVTTMATGIAEITTSLENARDIVVQYQDVVVDLQSLVSTVRQGLPDWLRWLRLGLSLVLIWLGIAQIGLFAQGWELIRRSRKPPQGAE